MSVIDERIVSMSFDNSRFQQNAQNTMDSLSALDESINEYTNNTSKSFLDLSDGLSRMDVIFAGFYEKIGGYLADLTMKGIAFSKSLSIDQVTAGFGKYTAETLAVQTIVSNTNNTLDHTYEILGDILDYTDKTSYHYDSMTNTMAKFANQGVELDQAALAVKGIANWAAISGAGIEKADITMNALIKSMASGNMQMREWRTISQVANMGTAQFKDTLIQTAQAMAKEGKASKDWLKITSENFESEDGVFGTKKLITSDVMLEVLKKYGDETSDLGRKALAAASEAKTFGEAIGAVKDAVSTGFGTSFRYLFGNYDEARKFWTMVQDMMREVFTIGIEFRNNILKTWHELGGYEDMVQGIADAWEALKNVVAPIGEIVKEVFNIKPAEKYADKLREITRTFKNWAERAKNITSINTSDYKEYISELQHLPQLINGDKKGVFQSIIGDPDVSTGTLYKITKSFNDDGVLIGITSEKMSDGISSLYGEMGVFQDRAWDFYGTFKNILELFKTGKDNVISFVKNITPAFNGIGRVAKNIYLAASDIIYFVTQLSKAAKEVNFFGRIAKSIASIISTILSPVFSLINTVLGKVGGKFNSLGHDGEKLKDVLNTIASGFEKFANIVTSKALGPLINIITKAFTKFTDVIKPIGGILSKAGSAFTEFFNKIGGDKGGGSEKAVTFLSAFGKAISAILDAVSKVAGKAIRKLKEFFSNFDLNKILATVKNLLINGLLVMLMSFVKNLAWISSNIESATRGMKRARVAMVLIPVAAALLALAAAMAMIAAIEPEQMAGAFGAIAVLMGEITAMTKIMQKSSKDMGGAQALTKTASAMTIMASAVFILAKAVVRLGNMSLGDLAKGVGGIGVLLAELVAAFKILASTNEKELVRGSGALVVMAAALDVLVIAVKSLGKMPIENLGKGIGSITILLAELVAAFKILSSSNEKEIIRGSGALIAIVSGIDLLVIAVKSLGKMSIGDLGKGLGSLTILMIELVAAFKILASSNEKEIIRGASSMIMMAAAVDLLSIAIKVLGSMPLADLAKGVGAVVVSLAGICAAFKLLPKGNVVQAGISLSLISVALIPFAVALKMIASMDLASIAIAVGTLAASLTILCIALNAANGALMGAVALSIISAALIPFAIAMDLLANIPFLGLVKGMGALIVAFGAFILLAPSLVAVLPVLNGMSNAILKIGLGVAALSAALIALNIIGPAALGLLTDLMTTIISSIPDIAKAVGLGLIAIIEVLTDSIEPIKELVRVILDAVIEIILEFAPKAAIAAIEILTVILEAIAAHMPRIVKAGGDIVVAFLLGLGEQMVRIAEAGFMMLITLINGIAEALRGNTDALLDAGWNLLTAIWEGFWKGILALPTKLYEAGSVIIAGLLDGLGIDLVKVKEWVLDLPRKVKDWILDRWNDLTEAGGNIVKGLKEGISNWWNNLGIVQWFKRKIGGLTSGAKEVLDEHSPSRVFAEIGRYIDEGLILGIENYSDKVNDASANMGKDAIDSMRGAIGDISDVVTGDFEEPVIRPVVDLSEVEKGASSIDDMLSNNYSLGLSASAGLDRTAGQNSDIYSPTINMTINGAQGQDVSELADIVADRINRTLRSRERVWA